MALGSSLLLIDYKLTSPDLQVVLKKFVRMKLFPFLYCWVFMCGGLIRMRTLAAVV